MPGLTFTARAIELVWAHLDQACGIAVIGMIENQQSAAPGRRARQPDRQLVCFAAAGNQVTDLERVRQQCRDSLRVFEDQRVQVAGVGIKPRHLPVDRLNHPRVTVTDMADVVDQVEPGAVSEVVEKLTAPARNQQRFFITEAESAAKQFVPAFCQRRARIVLGGIDRQIEAKHQVWVYAQTPPVPGFGWTRNAGEVPLVIEHVGHDLEMQVRRPVAVARVGADPPYSLPSADLLSRLQAIQRGRAQVAVQGKELLAIGIVLQDNRGSVIEIASVVGDTQDLAIQRRHDRRIGRCEQVQTQMKAARLRSCGHKKLTFVQAAVFPVAADARRAAGRLDVGEQFFGQGFDIIARYTKFFAAHRKIQHDRRGQQIFRNDRTQIC
ncbi:hypothetical protein MnTg04_01562 [bacterium MnTg04]|nr:hypothetical protein MnTg04_01562 [bacterium MnTg04]